MIKSFLNLLLFILVTLVTSAQKITYSQSERNHSGAVDFDIIGKMNNQYFVYNQVSASHSIFLYDKEMKLINKENMDFLPNKIVNPEIILYKDHFNFIYQYQEGNIVNCMAAQIDANGKIIGEPVTLDTTSINFTMNKEIYNVLYSEDKNKIIVYRVSNKADTTYITCSLFNEQFKQLDKFSVLIHIQAQIDFFSGMVLDNSGSLAFVKVNNPDINKTQSISLVVKNPYENNIDTYPLNIGKIYLSDIRIKADNLNNHFLITGFYLKQRKENIEGLYCAIWDKSSRQITVSKQVVFSDELKNNAKTQASLATAFNDYHLQNITMRKDGGFTIISECAYASTHNTYDYWTSNYYNSANWDDITYTSWSSAGGVLNYDYFAYNISLMSFDSSCNMEWSAVIPKNQYGKGTSNFVGYGIYQTSDEVNFLFNESAKKSTSMQSLKVNASGEVALNPTLRKLDRHYAFMPRFAKQVSSNEVLIPCQHKNNLCFAKIEF